MNALAIGFDLFGQLIGGMAHRLQGANQILTYVFLCGAIGTIFYGYATEKAGVIASGLAMALSGGLLIALCEGLIPFSHVLMQAAVGLGLTSTGGGGFNMNQLLSSPDSIYRAGLVHAEAMYAMADELCGFLNAKCMGSGLPTIPLYLAAWFIFGVFAVAAAIWFAVLALYTIGVSLALITLPLAIWGLIRSWGLAPIKYAAHSMAQMFSLSVTLSLCNMWAAMVDKNTTEPSIWASTGVIMVAFGTMVIVGGSSILAWIMTSGAVSAIGSVGSPIVARISSVMSNASNNLSRHGGSSIINTSTSKPLQSAVGNTNYNVARGASAAGSNIIKTAFSGPMRMYAPPPIASSRANPPLRPW